MLGRLLRHLSTYTAGNILLTLAGLISFPILTRLLSVADYGVLALVGTTISLLVAVSKVGVQQSIVRFHADLYSTTRRTTEAKFYATVLWGMGLSALAVTALWVPLAAIVPTSWWHDSRIPGLLMLTAVLIVFRVLDSAFSNILRAQQRSTIYATYGVVRRYAILALTLGTIIYWMPGLRGFYLSTVVGEGMFIVLLGVIVLRHRAISRSDFSPDLYRAMIVFGLPLMAYEISGILLNIGDRYVVQAILGSGSQGVYSAAYSLCEYVQAILLTSMSQALVPMYTRLWAEKGDDEARQFIQNVLHYYILVAVAVVGGLAIVGNSLIAELASDRYRSAITVTPLIMAGLVCDGGIPIFGAGLFIHKRTRVVVPLVAVCAVFNVILSTLIVPRIGVAGAALAMLCSYFILATGFAIGGRRYLKIDIPVVHLLKCTGMAVLMCWAISNVTIANSHLRLICQVVAGAGVYAALVLLFDGRSRSALRTFWLRSRR